MLSNAALWQLGLIFTGGRIPPRRGLLYRPVAATADSGCRSPSC